MCSTPEARLALIGKAIDDIAADSGALVTGADPDMLARRVAEVWAMVADLDPGVAHCLPGYTAGTAGHGQPGRQGLAGLRPGEPEGPGGPDRPSQPSGPGP